MNKNKLKKNNLFSILIGTIFILTIIGTIINATINTEDGGFRINIGETKVVTTSYGTKAMIVNNCPDDIFVPTRDKIEFDSFIQNRGECLTRYSCYKEGALLNNNQICAPTGTTFVGYTKLTSQAVEIEYCQINNSREVTSVIIDFSYTEYLESLREIIIKRINNAEEDITQLETDLANGILTDDGIQLKILSTKYKLADVKGIFEDGNLDTYDKVLPILTELELLIIAVPYEGVSLYELKVETESNLQNAKVILNTFDMYSHSIYFSDSIYKKIEGGKKIWGARNYITEADSLFDSGIIAFNKLNNNTAEDRFIDSKYNQEIGINLIYEVYNDIIELTYYNIQIELNKLNDAENEYYDEELDAYYIISNIEDLRIELDNAKNNLDTQTNIERGITEFKNVNSISYDVTNVENDLDYEIEEK